MINRTDSVVFREFEVFLERIYGLIHESLERSFKVDHMRQLLSLAPLRRHRPLGEPEDPAVTRSS